MFNHFGSVNALSNRMAKREWLSTGLVFIGALLLYFLTLAPGLLWGDGAYLQKKAVLQELYSGSMGHPLWVLLSHWFVQLLPFLEPPYAVNLFSAVCGALTVTVIAQIIKLLTGSRLASIVGAGVIALSHTFWLHAVITEVYALHLLFLAIAAWLILSDSLKRSVLAWFILALSAAVHIQTLPVIPAFALLTLHRYRLRSLVPLLAGIIGLLPFLYWEVTLPAEGSTVGATGLISAFFTIPFWQQAPRTFILMVAYTGYQFLFSSLAGLYGIWWLWRTQRQVAIFWLLWIAGSAAAAFAHRVPDQYVFYLPTWMAFGVLIGVGLGQVERWISRWNEARPTTWSRSIPTGLLILAVWLAPVLTYRSMGSVGSAFDGLVALRTIPYRDPDAYFFWPPKSSERGAQQYASEVFALLPPQSVLFADWTLFTPLVYLQQVENLRPDIDVIELPPYPQQARILCEAIGPHPMYIADDNYYYDIDGLLKIFEMTKIGILYSLIPLTPTECPEQPVNE